MVAGARQRSGREILDAGAPVPFPDFVDRGPLRLFSSLARNGPSDDERVAESWIGLSDAPFSSQASAIYDVMERALEGVGGLSSVLRQHMYQRDKRRFPILEGIRHKREGQFGAAPSSGLGLSSLRDESVNYELDAIALSPAGVEFLGPRTVLESLGVGTAVALYSQAVAAGPYIFTAGMLALSLDRSSALRTFEEIPPEGRWLQRGRSHPDYRMGPVVAQCWTLYERLHVFLESHGLDLKDVCESTIFVHNQGDVADAIRVHTHWFGVDGPAVKVIPVEEVGHKATVIEIEVTASRRPLRRTPGLVFEDLPAVVVSGDLIFVSDHLPSTDDCKILWVEEAEELIGRESFLADLVGDYPFLGRLLVAQVWMALEGMKRSLQRAAVDPEHVGQLTIRLMDNDANGFEWLDRMIRHLLGDVERAVVVLRVPWIAQSKYARTAIAGVGGVS